MSNDFMSAMKKTLNDEYNVAFTENGAAGYRTTGKSLLDLNFAVASLRKATTGDILLQYMKLTDEEIYAIRWHMSGFDSAVKGGDFGCSKAYDMCPFAVLLHLADMEATYLMEERSV